MAILDCASWSPGVSEVCPRGHVRHYGGGRVVRRARWDEAETAGFSYHREQMRSDPVVLAWVHRPDFWDAVVPGETGSQLTALDAPSATPTGATALQ